MVLNPRARPWTPQTSLMFGSAPKGRRFNYLFGGRKFSLASKKICSVDKGIFYSNNEQEEFLTKAFEIILNKIGESL